MLNSKKILAIIPARGGSKGLPGKNIKLIAGKPLIAWSIETAFKSKYVDDVIVSTDSDDIAKVATQYNAPVPFLRPNHLATDQASTVDVVLDLLDTLEKSDKTYDYLVLLEPTSPLRKDDDIDNMLEKIELLPRFDSIVSIGEVSANPYLMKIIKDDSYENLINSSMSMSRRQDLPEAFFPYGVAYIVKVPAFRDEKTFYTKKSTYFKIERFQCYEIDDIFDFLAAESVLREVVL